MALPKDQVNAEPLAPLSFTKPDDVARQTAEVTSDLAVVYSPIINFASGIVIKGNCFGTSQPNRLRCRPGALISWLDGGYGKLGLTANGNVPTPINVNNGHLQLPFHTHVAPITGRTFVDGDNVVVMMPFDRRTIASKDDPRFIDDAVLIECRATDPTYPALHASWPNTVTGFTAADVNSFLDSTWWWLETRAGWSGRYGHTAKMPSPGEYGYGGAMANVTSFGAMLLCSNLSSALKLQVQTRMLMMAEDLESFGITYDADGGHCNGRYILWLIRQIVQGSPTTMFTGANFSENQQIYRDVSNVIRWRFNTTGTVNPTYEYCCTINRWMGAAVCAKLATFLGQSASDWVTYTIGYMTANVTNPTGWFFNMSPRLTSVFLANRSLIGF